MSIRNDAVVRPKGLQPVVPRASSITKANIEAAYVYDNRRQQRRIEAFGAINRATLRALIVKKKKLSAE